MSEDKIVKVIYENITKDANVRNVVSFPTYNMFRYAFSLGEYCFEIEYDFMDSFYRIKAEIVKHNAIENIIFLTRSKRFKKDIKSILKKLNLSKKTFENHIIAFCSLLNSVIAEDKDSNYFEQIYISDLKFDGIFI